MSNRDRVLQFLRSIAPQDASNAEIVARTGIRPHQQVFMITRDLSEAGLIRGVRSGHEWRYRSEGPKPTLSKEVFVPDTHLPPADGDVSSPRQFELLAQRLMSRHYGVRLDPGKVPGVPKTFDLVSSDHKIVGDAKFYTLVRGEQLPPAKFSVIAEHVWLLEKVTAERKFLVFGNERQVPERWLVRYGALVGDVRFWFIDEQEVIHQLPAGRAG
jgi:hypothetical protein